MLSSMTETQIIGKNTPKCKVETFLMFSFVVKTLVIKMIREFLAFLPLNWAFSLLNFSQFGWKRLNSLGKMSKILRSHVVGGRFHSETKPCKTFHCQVSLSSLLKLKTLQMLCAIDVNDEVIMLLLKANQFWNLLVKGQTPTRPIVQK